MFQILFASNNEGKLREVQHVGVDFKLQVLNPSDIGKGMPPNPDESATTYFGNAAIKARAFYAWSGLPSLADDTGLEVDYLSGGPGVHSARYAGMNASSEQNASKLLEALRGEKIRSARFFCALYLMLDAQNVLTAEAWLNGTIALEPKGGGGFGYDSIFEVAGTGKTLAELKESGMAIETHRILACKKLFSILTQEA